MKHNIAVALACLITISSVIASRVTFAQSHQATVFSAVEGPVFIFPVNGTSYPASTPYPFQVQPINGATGYLWSFVEGGVIVYQNLAWEGHLSPANYTVAVASTAHNAIHSGDLHVWVRALLKSGQWSATSAVIVRIQGNGITPRATVTPGHPAPGTVLYQADTTGSLDRWAGTQDWGHVNGMLTNDGTNDNGAIVSPYEVRGTNNYAVEAEVAVVRADHDQYFGFWTRATPGIFSGYAASIVYNSCCGDLAANAIIRGNNKGGGGDDLTTQVYTPVVGEFHTYRLEVRGNQITYLIDGSAVGQITDNRWLIGSQTGIYTHRVQLEVRRYRVIAL